MRKLLWLLRGLVFLVLFGLALKNDDMVELRFFFGYVWRAPLSLVVLAVFFVGAALGLTAALFTLVRQWRELVRLRREKAEKSTPPAAIRSGG